MDNTSEIEKIFFQPTSLFNVSEWNTTNSSVAPPKSHRPGYTDSTVPVVVVYCVMFVIAAAGNLSVVVTLFRSRRHRRSRISLMICHLAVADLIVAFFMIPLEVGWRLTVEWYAGNVACKVFLFLRAFCLYLSSNVLVCVSLDRCFAVVYPLRLSDARKRGKTMLTCAWIIAMLNALPQSIVFRVQHHPQHPGFRQCVTFGSFSSPAIESAYNLFCLIAMYFVPLMIISIAYTAIVCEISNRSNRSHKEGDSGDQKMSNGAMKLRCNALSQIERARQRTFRLTITIVAGFIWCWTPYVVMTSWYIFDKESALKVDPIIQDGLFLMAVSNSCLNPLIYGSYSIKMRRFPWRRKRSKDVPLGCKTELQRRSTDAASGVNGANNMIQYCGGKNLLPGHYSSKLDIKCPPNLISNGISYKPAGTLSRTSVVTKLTNGRTNVQNWNKHHIINEASIDHASSNNNSKSNNLLNYNDTHRSHHMHHHFNKSLSNSQSNSIATNNSRTSKEANPDDNDYEEAPMNCFEGILLKGTIGGGVKLESVKKCAVAEELVQKPLYCISLGNMVMAPSESSFDFIGPRPSFHSDPLSVANRPHIEMDPLSSDVFLPFNKQQ